MPRWAVVAFLARCGRRFLPLYERDGKEPVGQRMAVSQAIALAEERATRGGDGDLSEVIVRGEEYVDNYDLNAMDAALDGCVSAALNTHADVEMAETETILAVTLVAQAAFFAAFGKELGPPDEVVDLPMLASKATGWSVLFAEPTCRSAVLKDYERLKLFLANIAPVGVDDTIAVAPKVFGPMWSEGRPSTWPPVELSFRPRARIIRTIGDRLISGPEAAVIELIKNSHDADASYVRVVFHPPLAKGEGLIVIEDDGHGMTLEDIERKWMEPATNDKQERKVSPGGRQLLGSKGIGRFATARLGRYLEMDSTALLPQQPVETKLPLRRETTRVSGIDWNDFEEHEYLEEVKFKGELLPAHPENGTTMRVSSLRDDWGEPQLKRLHEELRRLLSPIQQHHRDKPFKIFLDLSLCTRETCGFAGAAIVASSSIREQQNSSEREEHEIVPFPILEACDYSVDGIFDETGKFDGTMTIRRAGQEAERIDLDVPLHADEGEKPCGIVLVRLYIFDREAEAVRHTAEKAGFAEIGVREARKLLDSISGVAIYREGFRIRPYGDGENDWLTLDAKRVQNPSIKIGRNQIAGIVSVDNENVSQLIERSSREGLEENGAFQRLQSLILALLSEVVEPRRRRFRISAGLEDRMQTSFQDVYKQVQLGWSKILLAKIPEQDRAAAEELVTKESERLTAYIKRLEDRQATLEAKAAAGLIVGEVMHQGNTPLTFIENESARLDRWWPTIFEDTPDAREDRAEVPRLFNGLKASSAKLRALFRALSPLSGGRRGAPKVFDPLETISQTQYLFKSRIEKTGVTITVSPDPSGQLVVGYPADLATAVTNLMDNALYWLEYHNIANPSITIAIRPDGDHCLIRIADNGRGVPTEFADQAFDVGFTLKPSGTGLGLSIAKEAMTRSNGDLKLVSATGGAVFEIAMLYEGADQSKSDEEAGAKERN